MCALPAVAQTYPSKPIRLIVPFAPGGPNDVLARMVGQKLNEQWGQPVVIENRGGAGGTIGAEAAAKSPPDGYTLVMGGTSNLTVAPGLYARLGYDPVRDFTAIANVAIVPYALAVNPNVPAKTVRELAALARSKKGRLSFGSSGTGSISHIAAELFAAATGSAMVHVPYKGTAPALTDVIAGQIDLMFADHAAVVPPAKSGKLRILASVGRYRSHAAPELPTIGEAGVRGYAVDVWFGIVGPAGMPKDVVAKLNGGIAAALRLPDVLARLVQLGYEPIGDSPENFAATIRADVAKFSKVIKAAGIKAEL